MKKIICIVLAVCAVQAALAVTPDTFVWARATGWAWDTNFVWRPSLPENTNRFPNIPGDIAIIPDIKTNSAGNYQIWPNQFSVFFTTMGEFHLWASNSLTFGTTLGSPNGIIFTNTSGLSHLTLTNKISDDWWGHQFSLRFDTIYILSNDLQLTCTSPPDEVGDRDYAVIWFVDDLQAFGDHSMIKEGEGRWIVGTPYSGGGYSLPRIETTKPIYINNGWLEVNTDAVIMPPIFLNWDGGDKQGVFRPYDVGTRYCDLVFNGGVYINNYSGNDFATNTGNVTVRDQADFYCSYYGTTPGGDIRSTIIDGAVAGTNWVVRRWGGPMYINGDISPGLGPDGLAPMAMADGPYLGFLGFYSAPTDEEETEPSREFRIGSPNAQSDLHIEIDGNDSDYLITQDLTNFPLNNINLHLYITNPEPSATNLIWWSWETITGEFNSITLHPSDAQATIIMYDNAIEVTGTRLPGDFTVTPLQLEFTVGETQKTVTVSSDTEATVTIAALADATNWISVPAQVIISNGFPADVAITIPVDAMDGSTGMVRFTSVEQPRVLFDVQVTVIPEPILSALLILGAALLLGKQRS